MTKHNDRCVSTRRSRVPFWAGILGVMCVVSVPPHVGRGQERDRQQAEADRLVPDSFIDQLPNLSTMTSIIIGESLGVPMREPDDPNAGQRFNLDQIVPGLRRLTGGNVADNIGIGVHPTKEENEPTVAVSPRDGSRIVVGSHFAGPPAPTVNRCVAFRSVDGSVTWSEPFLMPHLNPASTCSDPVLGVRP